MTLGTRELDQLLTQEAKGVLSAAGQGPWTRMVQATLPTGVQRASCLMTAVSQLPRQAPELQGTRLPPGHLSWGAHPSPKAGAQALHHDSLAPRPLTPTSLSTTQPCLSAPSPRQPRLFLLSPQLHLSRMPARWKKPTASLSKLASPLTQARAFRPPPCLFTA